MAYISYCSSDEYSEYTGISMLSLLANTSREYIEGIFLLNNGIKDENLQKICAIATAFSIPLEIININGVLADYCRNHGIAPFNGSYSTYARLIPDKVYPSYVDEILVIDSDTLVVNSLDDLSLNMMGEAVIAAIDNPEMHLAGAELSDPEKESLADKGFYLNCGIVAYNLKNWRLRKISERIVEKITMGVEATYADQTVLNIVMAKEDVVLLPLKYNSFFHEYPKYLIPYYIKKYSKSHDRADIEEAIKNPTILHYKGNDMRPWFDICMSSAQDEYLRYKSLSPWASDPLKKRYTKGLMTLKFRLKKILRNTPLMVPVSFLKWREN